MNTNASKNFEMFRCKSFEKEIFLFLLNFINPIILSVLMSWGKKKTKEE